jgi:hypothetical protein
MILLKIIVKPIEVLAVTNELGVITPIQFKLKDDEGQSLVVKIDRIL